MENSEEIKKIIAKNEYFNGSVTYSALVKNKKYFLFGIFSYWKKFFVVESDEDVFELDEKYVTEFETEEAAIKALNTCIENELRNTILKSTTYVVQ